MAERTIYCGNLPSKITEDIVRELFVQVGPVCKVIMKQTESSNFAMVEFLDEESVLFAVDMLDGLQLHNTSIRVQPRNGSQQEAEYKRRSGHLDSRKRDHSGTAVRGNYAQAFTPPPVQPSFILPPPPIPPSPYNMMMAPMPPSFIGSGRPQPGYKVSHYLARPASSGSLDKWHASPISRVNSADINALMRSEKATFPQKTPSPAASSEARYDGRRNYQRDWERDNRYDKSRSSGGRGYNQRY